MEITKGPIDWDEVEDREILAQFLRTRTGQRLVPKIVESVPGLLGAGDTNAVLIRSGEVRGFQTAVGTLLGLAVATSAPEETRPAGSYPAPEDDAAWQDGQKLTE